MYTIGIDVGGTNVDFAIIRDQTLYKSYKCLIADDIITSINQGLDKILAGLSLEYKAISAIHLGSTIATNCILEQKRLAKVGLIRLAGHQPALPPAYQWPSNLRNKIIVNFAAISGGREFNNQPIGSVNREQLLSTVKYCLDNDAESLAIVGVFSPLYADDELLAAEMIAAEFGKSLLVTLSHQLGGLGFIERENTTLLNAALKLALKEKLLGLSKNLTAKGFNGYFFITQNNGTLITLSHALSFPVKTIVSGQTNSIVGACRLANVADAVVIDIGGTSTDIGRALSGMPIFTSQGCDIGSVKCTMQAPAIRSLAMGGGSIIKSNTDEYQIGPESVGAELPKRCLSMGGDTLTLHDVGQILLNECQLPGLSSKEAYRIMKQFLNKLEAEIKQILPPNCDLPRLLVGGGASIIPDELLHEYQFIRPAHSNVANAYGAALGEVSGEVDRIVSLANESESALAMLTDLAINNAIKNGATPSTVRITEHVVLPLYYMPEPLHRVKITAVGKKSF